jgi:NAD+ kinase
MFRRERLAKLKRIGILGHPLRPQTAPVAENIAATLEGCGVDTWLNTAWTESDVQDYVQTSDMVIAIGGDGAMLRAARVCAPFDVPVLGVNMGQLGFLTEIDSPDTWKTYLNAVLGGQYWIETRMMVRALVLRGDEVIASEDALNDVVISRGVITRIIRLEMYIDQDWATTYNADALIIATPTGSTAYALASGGPILPPELRNILVVPVAPHLSIHTEIVLTVDGRLMGDLHVGDRVRVQASEHVSRFVRMRERQYFYRSLLDRLEPRVSLPSRTKSTGD